MEKEILEKRLNINRRKFLSQLSLGIGSVALGSLMIPDLFGSTNEEKFMAGLPQFAPKAKRVIYLFQNKGLVQQWHVIKTESLDEGYEMTTKEGDLFYVFGDVTITSKEGIEKNYDWDIININEVEVNQIYRK